MPEFSEYPRVMFHKIEDPIAVYNVAELNKMLERGWKTSPHDFDEEGSICRDIKYHEDEIAKLKDRLIKLQVTKEPEAPVEEISTLAGESEVVEEEAAVEPEVVEAEVVTTPSSDGSNGDGKFTQPAARRRGRPSKVG